MANTPISMSKIRQILRLHAQGTSKLRIAEQTGIARNTLKKYLNSFDASGFRFEELQELSDKDLEDLFIKPEVPPTTPRVQTLIDLFPAIDKELKKKGVPRQLLWQAYKKEHPDGLGISQFKSYYAQWKAQVNPVMHIEHKAGDKLFIDFAGDKLHFVAPETGEQVPVEVFVSILGASQYTYVEAVMSQQKEDLIAACEDAFHFYGGIPAAIVPDNLKSAVTKSSKYEPTLNETFADFAEHYNTTVLPARAYRPRDKALVENAVRIIYSRIYVTVRQTVHTSLATLNKAVREALAQHNDALLRGRQYSRRVQFEEVERAALQPPPALRYELKKHCYATVAKNGHVGLGADKHYYSVPYRFIGKKVKLSYSRHSVEVYFNYERIALHTRSKAPCQYTTDKDHLASTHRFVSEWTADRFLQWAENIHEEVKLYVLQVLQRKQHPEQAYKACMGILGFEKKVGRERLVNACQRALGYGAYNYKTIQQILERELDINSAPDETDHLSMPPTIISAAKTIINKLFYQPRKQTTS